MNNVSIPINFQFTCFKPFKFWFKSDCIQKLLLLLKIHWLAYPISVTRWLLISSQNNQNYGVKEILEKATNMKHLYVCDNEMIIDSEKLIISFLDSIRDRIEVTISVKETNVHIDIRTILTDSKWLTIHM